MTWRAIYVRPCQEDVKAEVRGAWAMESVRRGVSHAKGGDYATAGSYTRPLGWFSDTFSDALGVWT
jgi:hypothetical protein